MADPTLESFASSLAPPAYDRAEASARRAVVQDALLRSTLVVTSMFESGSWSHGTAIKAKSDVDYMAIATGNRPILPSSALATARGRQHRLRLEDQLGRGFLPCRAAELHRSAKFRDRAGLVQGEDRRLGRVLDRRPRRRVVESAPSAHLDYVNRQNDRLGKRVKPLARLLKAWKYHVGAPVSSFYLEMRASEHAAGERLIIYDVDLPSVMLKIITANARDMNDPAHIVGRIPACSSDEKRRTTIRLLNSAVSSLEKAAAARQRGDQSDYWVAMREVFGSDYPWPMW
jgi:hypothetical protein